MRNTVEVESYPSRRSIWRRAAVEPASPRNPETAKDRPLARTAMGGRRTSHACAHACITYGNGLGSAIVFSECEKQPSASRASSALVGGWEELQGWTASVAGRLSEVRRQRP